MMLPQASLLKIQTRLVYARYTTAQPCGTRMFSLRASFQEVEVPENMGAMVILTSHGLLACFRSWINVLRTAVCLTLRGAEKCISIKLF